MRRLLVLWFSLIVFSGCQKGINSDSITPDYTEQHSCTLKGFEDTLTIQIQASSPLPANLTLAIDSDSEIYADECKNDQYYSPFFSQQIEFNADRTQAKVNIIVEWDSALFNQYLKGLQSTTSVNVSVRLFSRTSWSEEPVKFQQIDDAKITWESFEGNGPGCGFNYTGNSEIQLN